MKSVISAVAAALLLTSGAAFAAEHSPSTAAATSHAKTLKKAHTASVQSEKSKKCSAEANAQKLHGKARRAFRRSCMEKSA
ncbi:MAG TPA: PsiF family protein [Hyphomicrobium sp.]|nr:PsiF family protein [Hyphomicrobium sp.]